ncbi:Forkhead domain protein [Aspergillus sclerotialis]|uniref:Forkhead domain protein n=1 Tax=Aspergillus sclerotialis TaxID=2070753 RepID=A0A3A2Z4T1_9EURO|nr:Forkhead domain protein [Aspergillus sclerotialis]
MSSSQTMTTPAVGHRPPDSGPDMSLYDYRQSDAGNQPPSPPDSDSAGSAMQVSASDRPDSPTNGLPSVSGAFDIKTEPNDNLNESAPEFHQDNNMRRQSAASALLAQLLGGQSSAPADGTDQPVQQSLEDHCTNATQENNNNANNQLPKDEGANFPKEQNLVSGTDGSHGPEQGGKKPSEESQSDEKENNGSVLPKLGPVEGLSDPLMSRLSFGPPNIFPFDITGAPSNAFDALQQNEILTAAYLSSQSADLSALGFSDGAFNQDGTGSLPGSEPRIQAFAKLEFDDGHFYVNTYSFILGRDVRAARAAHQRESQARQAVRHSKTKSSSGGNASHTPVRAKHDGSNLIGSVVSDRGGIMGFDPDVPPHLPPQFSRRSSNSSHDPPLHATPAELQSTDYNALAMQSLDDGSGVKPVDTLSLLPSPEACPTIPIHPPATVDGSAAGHRGISRKHVKIAYNFEKNLFEMEVMGRNGAFIGADFLSLGQIRPLHSGDYIQIGGVRIRFLLPDVPVGETGANRTEEPLLEEDENVQASVEAEDDADEVERRGSDASDDKATPKTTKIILKTKETDPAKPVPSIESAGDSNQPAKRRGPGRPPKDGIMSKRERAELAREQKLAAKREANGGVTPPPNRSKGGVPTKESVGAESPGPKPEKRKYTKRKKPDGTPVETPFPSTEGVQTPLEQRPEDYAKPPPVKKRKPSRSPSPNYPPESAYTPDDLAKPPYNYAVLIFDALTEAGTPMTLKQIYRALKLKYPYFRFKCETEGWTSSVRHNLNGNGHLFMHAERDGKGWSWQLRPGASVEKEKKRRPSPPPPSSQPPPTPSGQHYMPPMNQPYNPPSGHTNMANQHFQFPSMPSNPYTAPAPQHQSPYPPPSHVPAAFPIPSPIRNNLPPAFAQTTPSTYTSPYASDPPPQLAQFQQQQNIPPPQPQPQPQPSYYQPPPPQMHSNPQPQNIAPHPGPPPAQQQPNSNVLPPASNSAPPGNSEASSFNERASKAIDDFEAVLMEDYEDKNYIREVLRSARARALGEATESSFPGGEPKDENVILDALRNLVGSLKDE